LVPLAGVGRINFYVLSVGWDKNWRRLFNFFHAFYDCAYSS
jgi:hypothetical protein